ncbi:hypothetical protein ANCDUO_15638 [Ancylostoma duodenale]|uniref:Uncharacterized protein n=1 Tax=Ancylostoma duodenale TaxID=51022 RepID=A0A0C2CWG2_9BILA|nr:hypothetical protein ANCDUO_15638 [Ancylostoma duodenale]
MVPGQAFSSLARGNQEILKEAAVQEPANRFGVSPQTILYAYGVCSGIGIIPNSANAEMLHNNLIKVSLLIPQEFRFFSSYSHVT